MDWLPCRRLFHFPFANLSPPVVAVDLSSKYKSGRMWEKTFNLALLDLNNKYKGLWAIIYIRFLYRILQVEIIINGQRDCVRRPK